MQDSIMYVRRIAMLKHTHASPPLWGPKYFPPNPVCATPEQARSLVSSFLPEPDGSMCPETKGAKGCEDRGKKYHDGVADSQDRERHCAAISVRDHVVVEVENILLDGLEGHDTADIVSTKHSVSHLVAPRC
jgi:hypothetical protein